MVEDVAETWQKDARRHADEYLAKLEARAREAGLSCDTVYVVSDRPYQAIVETAREKGCDLIAMATHTPTGLRGIFKHSETRLVLEHTDIPVLVFH